MMKRGVAVTRIVKKCEGVVAQEEQGSFVMVMMVEGWGTKQAMVLVNVFGEKGVGEKGAVVIPRARSVSEGNQTALIEYYSSVMDFHY
jgi:hypothetical protein